MFTLLFVIACLMIVGKLIGFTVRASWTVLKVLMYIVFLPILMIVLLMAGLIYIALPILLIVGIVSLVVG